MEQFKFYKENLGLYEFAQELYPEQYAEESDNHPLPFTHYKWVKDIIFKSDIEPPEEEYRKLKEWKTLNLKKKSYIFWSKRLTPKIKSTFVGVNHLVENGY